MGSIFGFISSDVVEKIGILHDLLKETKAFTTVKGMIEYEKNNKVLDKKGHTSGSRTLLRLHRGLGYYITKFGNFMLSWYQTTGF